MDNFQWDQSDFEGLVKDNKCFSAINSVYQAVKKFKNENGHPISYLQFKTLQNESQELINNLQQILKQTSPQILNKLLQRIFPINLQMCLPNFPLFKMIARNNQWNRNLRQKTVNTCI
jgi:hypothetical protein